jgi:hypothetical protein
MGGILRWLPVEDLFLEDWRSERLLVSRWVPAPLAPIFGDGRAPFPEDALLQRGMSPHEIRVIRCGMPAETAVSRLWGDGLAAMRQAASDALLEATWMDYMEGYLGEASVTAFRALRSGGRPGRVVVWQEC